jgi:hypothetical protein
MEPLALWSLSGQRRTTRVKTPAGLLGLAKVKTGASIYVQMSKVLKAITISNDTESNKGQEQQSKQQ